MTTEMQAIDRYVDEVDLEPASLADRTGAFLLDVGLAVAREDGLRVGWWEAVIRRLPLFFEVFWLDALFAPFTEKRQRAFDIVAGTVVVPGGRSGVIPPRGCAS